MLFGSSRSITGELTAAVTVRNAGSTPGREAVQLYVSAPGKALPKPALELRGFAKTYAVKVGASSEDIRQTATFTKAAEERLPR